jgi:hypothetical protein
VSYASVMVYVEADGAPEQRVRLATGLADEFNAMLIGLSALAAPPPVVAAGMVMDEPTDADIELMRAKLADFRSMRSHARRGVPISSSSDRWRHRAALTGRLIREQQFSNWDVRL